MKMLISAAVEVMSSAQFACVSQSSTITTMAALCQPVPYKTTEGIMPQPSILYATQQ